MSSKNDKTQWVYLPLLLCSTAAIAAGQSANDPHADEFREVNNANYEYVGGKTRVGVGVDTEFDGTADISHVFSETQDTATSGDVWAGFDVSGDDKGINAGGVKLNHHWVNRDEQGRPLRVNKVFGAYDRNTHGDDKVTVGYGQEIDKGFWEGYVGKGLSGKRRVGVTAAGQELFEKGYEYNVGGQVGKFLPGSDIRVRGGLDYAWDSERGIGESKPSQVTVSGGVEKFFRDTPHSVSLDVAASRKDGGHGGNDTDTRANLSYRYDFGGADIYQSDKAVRRVRVEVPGHSHPAKTVRKAVKVPYQQAYKKAVKVRACQLVKSTVELGSDTFFQPNSSRLLPSAKQRLNQIIAQIRKTGYQGHIRITGNTCDVGTLAHNQKLSERRASAVKKYLAAKGFDANELIARGLGETHPKYANTPASRHKNRRVDIEYVTEDASCKDGYKTVYKTAYKTAYKTEFKDVKVAAGQSQPQVTWKTEVVNTEPLWVKRALRNPVRHNRYVSTYQTTAGSQTGPGQQIAALNDVATTVEGQPVTIDVLANDTGSGLSITSTSQPANGAVSIVNGQVVYTPAQGFTGTDIFTYAVTDSQGNQSQGAVTVTVTPQGGTGPTAGNDTATTTQGTAVTIDALANDTGNGIVLTSVSQPAIGAVNIVNGQIVYTPGQNFVGTESFNYVITDANGAQAQGTITVTVTAQGGNVPPVAVNDTAATTQNTAVTIDALANDTSDGQGLAITNVGQPTNGTAAIVNGQVVYTPAQGFVGTDSFTYTITDSNGAQSQGSISVTVTAGGGNNPPAASDDAATTTQNTAVTINPLSNDTGNGITLTNVAQPANGSVNIVNGSVIYTPAQGFTGTDSFTYTITDATGAQAQGAITVTVTTQGGGNNPPAAGNDTATTTQNTAVTVNPLSNDTGNGITLTNVAQPVNGSVNIVNGSVIYTPAQGFTGTDNFTYTITDADGEQAEGTITVTVTAQGGGNNPPAASNDSATTTRGTAVTIDALSNDTSNGGGLAIIDVAQPANGSATVTNGMVVYTPGQSFTGTDSFTYTISDANGAQAQATITVTVTAQGANNPPVANNDTATSTGSAVTIDVTSNDTSSNNSNLTVTTVDQPQNGTTVVSGNQVVYTPDSNFSGTDTFDYSISDDQGNPASATVVVTVTQSGNGGQPNQSPVAADDTASTLGGTISIDALANDSDPDGDALVITTTTQPNNGQAGVVNGQIIYTPVQGFTGLDSFSYTIADSEGLSSTAMVSVNVDWPSNPNKPPLENKAPDVNNDYLGSVSYNQNVTINPLNNDSDPDGDQLSIISIGGTSLGNAVDNGDGSITFTPKTDFCGDIEFTYTVTDGNGHTKTATIYMTVS